ncbi:hypothetical protein GOODEAATRI_011301 [Goodea atripinnis]|uniref:NADH dehydrogenase subunit 6 n=1 Tax=Goodea atripinnis TaxID=208336 RepID=A0ABV0N0G5_9TELE
MCFLALLAWLWLRSGAGHRGLRALLAGSAVVGHVGHVPSFVWRIVVALGWVVCSFFFIWSGAALLVVAAQASDWLVFWWASGIFGQGTGCRGWVSRFERFRQGVGPGLWLVLGARCLSLALNGQGCLLGSAAELAPWERILPPSPSLPILGHLPPPTSSHYHS